MKIATAGSRTSKRWKTIDVSWDWLLDHLRMPKRTGETVAEYRRMSKDEQAQRKDVGGFVGGALSGPRRVGSAVTERWLITLDADEAGSEDWEDWCCLYDYRSAIYSTHSHTPESPRIRWVLPLRRPVGQEEYQAIARRVAEWIGIETMDVTTYQPERLMYWPSCPEDGEYLFDWQDGQVLDPDAVLRTYGEGEAWRDAGLWPISSKEKAVIIREVKRQGDPETKPGIVGKFCRAYDVPSAIDKWLQGVYEVCDSPAGGQIRYTYLPGSSSGGAVLYDNGKFLYSHHSTDPTCGELCNAFDLVRLHLFGEQDAGHEQQEINRKPSYKAMCDMVARDDDCKRAFLAEHIAEVDADFGDLAPEQSASILKENTGKSEDSADTQSENVSKISDGDGGEDDSWMTKLAVNRKTGEAESTIENAVLILANDPNLAGRIALNEFSGRPTLRGSVPWRKAKDGDLWEDADEANLRLYLERRWGFSGKDKINDALSITLKTNAYHPVREYLQGLEWDGVERLDTCIVRYLETDDTPYVRAVTRKWMCGAVKRIMEPGCKFDSMLLIQGQQNVGKSRFCQIISRGWINTSIARMDGKEAYEAVRGVWIVEVAELAAARRSEQESQKQFLSAQTDTYRPAYGKNVVVFPRQCVFFGTTNDPEPLKDDTGGRRYWVVRSHKTSTGTLPGLEEEVDQLWAEALVRYRAGEKLWLDDDLIAKEAQEIQAENTYRDEWIGIIQDFLDRPIPKDWESRSPEDRRAYIAGDTLEKLDEKDLMRRNRVSGTEIRVECIGEDRTGNKGNDLTSRRIARIMGQMPGWGRGKKAVRLVGYGKQKVYERDLCAGCESASCSGCPKTKYEEEENDDELE